MGVAGGPSKRTVCLPPLLYWDKWSPQTIRGCHQLWHYNDRFVQIRDSRLLTSYLLPELSGFYLMFLLLYPDLIGWILGILRAFFYCESSLIAFIGFTFRLMSFGYFDNQFIFDLFPLFQFRERNFQRSTGSQHI